MTQLEAARQGLITEAMRRVAQREHVSAGTGPRRGRARPPGDSRQRAPSGRQRRSPAARRRSGRRRRASRCSLRTLGQRVLGQSDRAQRGRALDDPDHCRGESAPKRLDPTGIGRMITTKINANIGASPVSSSTDGGGREAALGAALRRRHGDGSLDRRRSGRVPSGHHRPQHGADRHRADLQHDHRPAHRRSHLRR